MESLQAFFDRTGSSDIHAIGQYTQQHVNTNWETIYQNMREEMIDLYQKIGDSAYGRYGERLFQPIHDQFKQLGLKAVPRLPGNFGSSREWGEEDDRQRWMWSKIVTSEGTAVGTIVTAFYHDHYQIRIPRAFRIIALDEISKGDVVKALSKISPEFGAALEARIEYAQYK